MEYLKQGCAIRIMYLFCAVEFLRLLTSVFATDYLIPRLPGRLFFLEDVIVLPINSDNVSVSVTCGTEEFELSLTEDFRVTVPLQSVNISAVLNQCDVIILKTDKEANVMLEKNEMLLSIHSSQTYGQHYVFINNKDTPGDHHPSYDVLLLAAESDTLVKMCPVSDPKSRSDYLEPNFTLASRFIPETINCSEAKVSAHKSLLLDTASYVRGIEIFSNNAIGVLAISVTNLSSKTETRRDVSMTEWHPVEPVERWGNQFLILTEAINQEVGLILFCFEQAHVAVYTDTSTETFNITSGIPFFVNTTKWNISSYVRIISTNRMLVQCSSRSRASKADSVGINVIYVSELLLENGVRNTSNAADEIRHRKIFVAQNSSLSVVCLCATNISVQTQSGDVIEQPSVNAIRHDNTTALYLYRVDKLLPGEYRVNESFSENTCKYVVRSSLGMRHVWNSSDDLPRNEQIYIVNFTTNENVTDKDPDSSNNSFVNGKRTNVTYSDLNVTTATDIFRYTEVDYKNRSISDVNFNKSESNSNDSETGFIPTMTIVNRKPTYGETTTLSLAKLNNKNRLDHIDLSSNDRFKMVVDIDRGGGGDHVVIGQNEAEDKQTRLPTYIIHVDTEEETHPHGGRSLSAIVISLVAAILAVVVFILMFVLWDFLSRRNQLRKTRIRPFVSYY